jgi:hypothetical protein
VQEAASHADPRTTMRYARPQQPRPAPELHPRRIHGIGHLAYGPDSGYLCLSRPLGVGAGSGEVLGRTLFLRLPVSGFGRGSFMACVPVGCRGEAWLKKGL